MAHEALFVGLDLGSYAIRVAAGKRLDDGQLQILGVGESPSAGISKGMVTSVEDAVSSVSTAFEKSERMIGQPIERVTLGITGTHIRAQETRGVVAVSKADGEIREDDVERVIDAAQAVSTPPNYEMLHVIPRSYTVDEQSGIKDPVGMSGIRLEVRAQVLQGLTTQIKHLTKCVYRTGVDIGDVVVGVLASAEAALTRRQKDLGVAILNLGASTTSLMVFEEGDVLHTAIFPIGAAHITNDIAIGLRTSIDLAERVKVEVGTALPDSVSKHDTVDLSEFDEQETERISRKHLAEIIGARLEEIYDFAEKELKKIQRSGLLPAGVVLTGGGAKLPGVVEVAKERFRLPASIGVPMGVTSAIDKINDPAFTTAVGLVLWSASLQNAGSEGGLFRGKDLSSIGQVTGKMKKWLKTLIP